MRLRWAFVFLGLFTGSVNAEQLSDQITSPKIAIIIDDLGDRLRDGRKVISLSGKLTVGIIPYTPFARKLAHYATENDKEILLHLPMESLDNRYLGKSGLHSAMTEEELKSSLQTSLSSIKNIRGVSNHMGSRLTQDKRMMHWLMQGLRSHGGLYFLDSRTINSSQALVAARQVGIEHATRDVFLDNDTSVEAMTKQWRYFLKRARKKGSAILIAHPYPETIAFLQAELRAIKEEEYQLVTVSELIRWRHNRSKLAWQHRASSSR